MKYLIRTIQIDRSGNWYRPLRKGTKSMIMTAFDSWRWAPAQRIDLIRTVTGVPIYFEAMENGHHVCQIEYQITTKNVKR